MDGIEVGSALSASLNANQTHFTQFFDISVDALAGGAHVSGETVLAGKAFI